MSNALHLLDFENCIYLGNTTCNNICDDVSWLQYSKYQLADLSDAGLYGNEC